MKKAPSYCLNIMSNIGHRDKKSVSRLVVVIFILLAPLPEIALGCLGEVAVFFALKVTLALKLIFYFDCRSGTTVEETSWPFHAALEYHNPSPAGWPPSPAYSWSGIGLCTNSYRWARMMAAARL